MSSNTQYMIDNYASLVTCSETHTLHMPVPMHYNINQLTARQDAAILD